MLAADLQGQVVAVAEQARLHPPQPQHAGDQGLLDATVAPVLQQFREGRRRGQGGGVPGEVHRPPVVRVDQAEVPVLAPLVEIGDTRAGQAQQALGEAIQGPGRHQSRRRVAQRLAQGLGQWRAQELFQIVGAGALVVFVGRGPARAQLGFAQGLALPFAHPHEERLVRAAPSQGASSGQLPSRAWNRISSSPGLGAGPSARSRRNGVARLCQCSTLRANQGASSLSAARRARASSPRLWSWLAVASRARGWPGAWLRRRHGIPRRKRRSAAGRSRRRCARAGPPSDSRRYPPRPWRRSANSTAGSAPATRRAGAAATGLQLAHCPPSQRSRWSRTARSASSRSSRAASAA